MLINNKPCTLPTSRLTLDLYHLHYKQLPEVLTISLLFSYDFLLINTCSLALGFIFLYELKVKVILSLMVYILERNDRSILVKIGILCFAFYICLQKYLYVLTDSVIYHSTILSKLFYPGSQSFYMI